MAEPKRRRRANTGTGPRRRVKEPEAKAPSKAVQKRLAEIARKLDDNRVEIEQMGIENQELEAEAFKILQDAGIENFLVPNVGTHEVEEKKGNASSSIDIEKYWDAVTEEEFFATVSVTAKAAGTVLPSKKLDAITTKIPGELKPPSYKFTPLGAKK